MWVRSDVTSGRNRRWECRPDAGDAEDGKTTSDASGRGARASDAGLTFADESGPGSFVVFGFGCYHSEFICIFRHRSSVLRNALHLVAGCFLGVHVSEMQLEGFH